MKIGKNRKAILVSIFTVFTFMSFLVINRAQALKKIAITMDKNTDELLIDTSEDSNDQYIKMEALSSSVQRIEKDETIYVNLDCAGGVLGINVVNHFKTGPVGIYQDFGSYESITNLTDDTTPSLVDDSILWEFTESSVDFYYQGRLQEGELPWSFDIRYYLDQKETSADMLAGSEGELLIRIEIKENNKAEEYFRKNYMLQLTIPINLQNSSIISAPGAIQMITGRTNTLAYTVLAQSSKVFEIKLKVKDFSMESIDIAIMKADVSTYMETENMTSGFQTLSEGMEELEAGTLQLKEGISQLSTGIHELSQGLSRLSEGTHPLGDGMKDFNAGLETMKDNMGELSEGSLQIQEGLRNLAPKGDLLVAGYQELEAGIRSIVELEPQLRELANLLVLSPDPNTKNMGQRILEQLEGLKLLQEGMVTLNDNLKLYTNGITQLSNEYDSFHHGISSFPDGIVQMSEGFQKLEDGNAALYSAVTQLSEGAKEIDTSIYLLPSQVQQLADGQGELKKGANLAINELQTFTNNNEKPQKPISFVAPGRLEPNSVQFILRTPAIQKKQVSVEEDVTKEDKTSFWDRLTDLF